MMQTMQTLERTLQPPVPVVSIGQALRTRAVWLCLAAFSAVHLTLWAVQPDLERKILTGDRAGDRLRALDQLVAADGLDARLAVIFRVGSPGDYVLFAPVYALFGAPGIVFQSLVLYSIALVALYALARRLLGEPSALIATAAWVALPSTLFHPHVLVTETICNPLLVLLLVLLVRLHDAKKPQPATLVAAACLTAILVFVRHVFLLLPFAIALWLIAFRPRGVFGDGGALARPLARYLGVSFAIIALWWVTLALGSFRYPPSESIGGLQSNLFLRAERMAYLGHVELPVSYAQHSAAAGKPTRLFQPLEFVGFAAKHPVLFTRTAAADAFNMMVNPGVAMLAGRYLGLFDLAERSHRDLNKWREVREKQGFLGLARLLLETSPVGLAVNAAGLIAWIAFLAVAALGAVRFMRDATREPALRWLLAGLVVYVAGLTCLTAGYTRWDHRTPMDVALVLFFAAGVMDLRSRHAGSPRLAVA